jgi:aryl-alcohol dehydrogenase-like predicted oxidoreductase
MKYKTLGKTGINVSRIGFGAWAIGSSWGKQDEKDSIAALHKAIDLGINFIDTALGYGDGKSERIIGKVLKERNEEVFVASKIPATPGTWPPDPYAKIEERYPSNYLREQTERSLQHLGLETIDVMQLHTWTRAWNQNPIALEEMQKLKKEGKIRNIGISTPEHDQNALVQLIREGYLDTVQLIFNIFEQEPAAELLPAAQEHGTGVIVRVALDEGMLTGKYDKGHQFPEDDFRSKYFAGDRLERSVERVNKIKEEIKGSDFTMPQAALKFVLAHPAVSTVITGIRDERQAQLNAETAELPDMPDELVSRLQAHAWNKGFWHAGK